jgi:hypothetical protein
MLLLSQPSARLPSPVCSPNDPCRRLPASAPKRKRVAPLNRPSSNATAPIAAKAPSVSLRAIQETLRRIASGLYRTR